MTETVNPPKDTHRQVVRHGHGLPRSRAINFSSFSPQEMSQQNESVHSLPHSSVSLSNSSSDHRLHCEPTWATISRTSVASDEVLSLPSELQQWYRATIDFAERLSEASDSISLSSDLRQWYRTKIEYAERISSESERTTREEGRGHNRDQSWVTVLTDTATWLPHNDRTNTEQPTISIPLLDDSTAKQQRRNAFVFPSPMVSRPDFSESSIGQIAPYGYALESSVDQTRQFSSRTLVSGTSGGYREDPGHPRRDPPHHDLGTLMTLEGKGPFVLDARDISASQFRNAANNSDASMEDRRRGLQSLLINSSEDGSEVEVPAQLWTSESLRNMGTADSSVLENVEGDSPTQRPTDQSSLVITPNLPQVVERLEDRSSLGVEQSRPPPVERHEDRSPSMFNQNALAPHSLPRRAKSMKDRFGRLGRWFRKKVLGKESANVAVA